MTRYVTTEPFRRVFKVGRVPVDGAVWVSVNWDGRRLSFQGVVGPLRNGDCRGPAGQIPGVLDELVGWSLPTRAGLGSGFGQVLRLKRIWKRWLHEDVPDDVLEFLADLPHQEDCPWSSMYE